MSRKFLALSITLTLCGPLAGMSFAADDGYEQDGYGKPSIDITKDVNIKKDTDIKKIDITKNDNDVTNTKDIDIKKTNVDITKSDNDVTNTKDIDIKKTSDNDVNIKKITDIKKTDIDITKSDNDVTNTNTNTKDVDIKKTDVDTKIYKFSQNTKGDLSPNVNKSNFNDNNLADQWSSGSKSPNLNNSAIKDSAFVDQNTKGAASPNLYDSTIKNSDLVGGNQDNSSWSHNKYDSTGQVNLTQSKADGINAADHYSTIFDGDVSFGGGGKPMLEAADSLVGYGAGGANINTGIAQNSVIGNYSAQFNNVGIGINGEVGGPKGEGANFNNTQNQTLNIIGGSN